MEVHTRILIIVLWFLYGGINAQVGIEPIRREFWTQYKTMRNNISNGKVKEANFLIDHALGKELSHYPDLKAHLFLLKSLVFMNLFEQDSSLVYLKGTEHLIQEHKLDTMTAIFLCAKAFYHRRNSDLQNYNLVAKKGLREARRYGQEVYIKSSLRAIVDSFVGLGQKDSTQWYNDLLMDLAEETKDTLLIATCNNYYAQVVILNHDFIKGADYIFKAYEMGKKTKSLFVLTHSVSRLHYIYSALGNYKQALEYTEQLLSLLEGLPESIPGYELSKIHLLTRLKRFNEAQACLQSYEERISYSRDSLFKNHYLAVKGGLRYGQGDIEAAKTYLLPL